MVSIRKTSNPQPTWIIPVCLATLASSGIVFFVSLSQDAYFTDRHPIHAGGPAFFDLLLGWMVLSEGVLAWLANPTLLLAWLLMWFRSTRIAALLFALASLGFCLSFLRETAILGHAEGWHDRITGYGPAYWLWMTSIGIAVAGCVVCVWLDHRTRSNAAGTLLVEN